MKDSGLQPRMTAHTAPTSSDDDEIDLMELFRALWRGKWLIALSALVAVVLGGYYAIGVAAPQYRATAQLTLEVRSGQVVDLQSVMTGVSTEQAALNTEIEIITSRRILGKLVDTLDLTSDPEFNSALEPPSVLDRIKGAVAGVLTGADEVGTPDKGYEKSTRDAAIDALRKKLSASVQRDTYVFNISATTGDAEKSAQILNTLADLYLQEQIAVKFEATEQAVAWLSTRVTELEADLREKENMLKSARAETELISPESLEALNLQAKTLRERLGEMRAGVDAARAEIDRLENLREAGDRAAAADATGDATLRRLLQSLRDGEADAADMFDQRLDVLIDGAEEAHDRQLSQTNALAESHRTLQERIERQSADLVRIEQMTREVETTRTLYETFLTRLKETTVQRGLQQADSRVLSDAIPGAKVAPRTTLVLALSMVLGLMVGAAVVLVRQFLHNTFRTAEDLEHMTGLPVLGQIPKLPFKPRDALIGYLKDKPTSALAEAIRNLRTSLLLSDIDHPPQIIMSTSALPGEGKTTQAIALTQSLAGLDKKVLLIECDIRRRTFAQYFSDVPAGGILTALSGEVPLSEVVFHDERVGADILMGEKSRANAADLFSSDKFRTFLARAREAYDFVIIDTPPVLLVPDARVIGQHVDAILFSVAWDRTPRAQVIAALREFESVNLKVTGIALAQIDPKGMRGYGYGKGYYEAGQGAG